MRSRNTRGSHLCYELACLRYSPQLRLTIAGVVAVAAAMTVIVLLSAHSYLELDDREFWALIATQGGTFTWPPLFAYLLALYGVMAWANDTRGESAYVAYLGFASRARTAAVRSIVLSAVAALASLLALAVAIGVATLHPASPGLANHVGVIAVKALWMVICGVGMAHLGALLCVLFRSSAVGLSLLLVVPWLVEPLLVQLLELIPVLHPVAKIGAYLPFRVSASVLGERPKEDLIATSTQLGPSAAALVVLLLTTASIMVVQWRYCVQDAAPDR